MKKYLVKWEIDVEAESVEEAVKYAREAQRPGTDATSFDVYDEDEMLLEAGVDSDRTEQKGS